MTELALAPHESAHNRDWNLAFTRLPDPGRSPHPAYGADRKPAPTRLPTDPGTPALIPAGPNAEALARAVQKKVVSANDAATNPTEATPGANPPPKVDGNFLIGPTYVPAPELSVTPGVPQGRVQQFSMESTNSKFYPGIARNAFGTVDPNNPKTLIVETHPAPYTRTITVYIPSQYVSGTAAPFIVTHDGPRMGNPDLSLPHILDNMIAQHRLPGDACHHDCQWRRRRPRQRARPGIRHDVREDSRSSLSAEVLPLVEKNCQVKLTKDPEGRATMGGSSGGAAALEMAWYHPEWYHRVITYSGTYVNQQWPFNPETPDGAWDFHEKLIPQSQPEAHSHLDGSRATMIC